MIKNALLEAGIKREELEIVPFPINMPVLLKYYVPIKNSVFYMTVYDRWSLKKKKVLESLGANVEVLNKGKLARKKISSSLVRENISLGKRWDRLVPPAVYRKIKELRLESRIR